METTTTTTMKTKTLFDRVQYDIIGTDIGHRGMKPLIVPGDLEHAARCIVDTLRTPPRGASSSSSSSCGETTILVLSGFPCCVTQVPPTETDGPPGTYAIVRAVYQLATQQRNSTKNPTPQQQPQQPPGTTHIIVVTDDCNRAVFAAGLENLALSNTAEDDQDQDDQDLNDPKNMKDRVTINNNTNTGKNTHCPQHTTTSSSRCTISLETFPASAGFTSHDHARLEHLATTTDLIISCERAGPAKDGNCYTMKGINMNEHNLIAPLEQLLTRRRRRSSSSRPKFIAIGDGGNELGMGKVLEHIRQNNPLIDQGDKIGCVVPADYLIAASVSNWGGYALAACVAVVAVTIQTKTNTTTTLDAITHQLDQCLPTIEQEHALLQRCVEAGCRDGVSGQRACTVDGMPFETSMECLTAIRRTILEYYTTIG